MSWSAEGPQAYRQPRCTKHRLNAGIRICFCFRTTAAIYGRALYFSYSSVCLLVSGMSRPLMKTCLI